MLLVYVVVISLTFPPISMWFFNFGNNGLTPAQRTNAIKMSIDFDDAISDSICLSNCGSPFALVRNVVSANDVSGLSIC